jgi:hypothetical protein
MEGLILLAPIVVNLLILSSFNIPYGGALWTILTKGLANWLFLITQVILFHIVEEKFFVNVIVGVK